MGRNCRRRARRAIVIAALGLTFAGAARGDTFRWVGTSGSNAWLEPNNWVNQTDPPQSASAYPTAGDTAVLDVGGHNFVNLIVPDVSVDTLQLPGPGGSVPIGYPWPGGSPSYTVSSNSGTGSSVLHLNQITAGPGSSFGFGGENVIDGHVTLQGPADSALGISLGRSLTVEGNVVAPGGLAVNSRGYYFGGGVLELKGNSNSFPTLNISSGTVAAYGPGSIRQTTINMGSGSFFPGSGLTLVSDAPLADYGNDIHVNGSATLTVRPTVQNDQPFGDPAASVFRLGDVTIHSMGPFSGAALTVNNSHSHDVLQFQNLDVTGKATLFGAAASYNNPRTVGRFTSLTGHTVDTPEPTDGPIIVWPVGPGPSSLTINGGEFDIAGAGAFPGPTTVQAGLLVAQSDGALGNESIVVNQGGALRFDAAQTNFPSVLVDAGGAIGGDLTGVVYGHNVTLTDGAILVPTAGPLPARGPSGPVYWRGVDSLNGTFTVGDDGTSIYRGAAFGSFTPDGPFVGTLNEAAPGAGIQILAAGYTAIGDPVGGGRATFNTTKDVTITIAGTYEVDFFQPLAGTARVFNLVGPAGSYNLGPGAFNLLGSGVIPAGYTVNLQSGYLYFTGTAGDAVANGAKVNVMSGATLAGWGDTSLTTGTFEIEPGGIFSPFGGTASGGATFIFHPGSIIELRSGIPDATWVAPQSDILITGGGQMGTGLQLGPGQRISTIATSGGYLTNTPITARPDAPADATYKFTSSGGTLQYDGLYIDGPVTFGPGQTLQIGDTVPWSYDGQVPNGVVHFDHNFVTAGKINIVSGTLLLGSPGGGTPPQVDAGTVTVGEGATLAGSGDINAGQLTIAGTIAPGFSPGTLHVNADTTLEGGALYQWQIDSAVSIDGSAAGHDLFVVDGVLTIAPSAATDPILVLLQSLDSSNSPNPLADFDPTQSYAFPFIKATDIVGFDADDFLLDLSQFQNPYDGTWSIQQAGPGELDIVYTAAVPEPATVGWLVGTTLMLCRISRRTVARNHRKRGR